MTTTTTPNPKAFVSVPGKGPTPSGRANFVFVFEPDKKEKYSLMLVFKKDEVVTTDAFNAMISALNEASHEKFGVGYKDEYRGKPLNSPFKTHAHYPDLLDEDEIAIRLKSKYKPNVLDGDAKTKLDNKDDFYSGVICRATYSAVAYDVDGSRGVMFQLNNLQKTGVGERFQGRGTGEDDFDAVGYQDVREFDQQREEHGSTDVGDEDIPF